MYVAAPSYDSAEWLAQHQLLATPLSQLNLSAKVVANLVRHGITTIGELALQTEQSVHNIRQIGPRAMDSLQRALFDAGLGFRLPDEPLSSIALMLYGDIKYIPSSMLIDWQSEPEFSHLGLMTFLQGVGSIADLLIYTEQHNILDWQEPQWGDIVFRVNKTEVFLIKRGLLSYGLTLQP